jgi:NAD(P)-dependent dehydrogenase (short-subunit alcohol dehydrogenase family)
MGSFTTNALPSDTQANHYGHFLLLQGLLKKGFGKEGWGKVAKKDKKDTKKVDVWEEDENGAYGGSSDEESDSDDEEDIDARIVHVSSSTHWFQNGKSLLEGLMDVGCERRSYG